MRDHHTATARIFPLLFAYLERAGVDPAPVCAVARLDVAALRAPDAELRVPLVALYDFVEEAAAQLGDEAFGLRLVEDWTTDLIQLFDVAGYLMYTSPTMMVALRRFSALRALWSDGEAFWQEVEGDQVRVGWRGFGAPRLAHRLIADMVLSDIVRGCAALGDGALVLHAVQLPYAPPDSLEVYQGWLDVPLVFRAPHLELVCDRAALERPLPSADPVLFAYFEAQAQERAAALQGVSWSAVYGAAVSAAVAPVTMTERVRRAVIPALPDGAPTIDALAPRLGCSPRTLQRKLREEQTTFSRVLDETRHTLALRYLREHVPLGEIAYLLGFSEPSAFHRAFKRWSGESPAVFRQRLA